LRPAVTPAARKPWGAVTDIRRTLPPGSSG
jgi:hypothetical protein